MTALDVDKRLFEMVKDNRQVLGTIKWISFSPLDLAVVAGSLPIGPILWHCLGDEVVFEWENGAPEGNPLMYMKDGNVKSLFKVNMKDFARNSTGLTIEKMNKTWKNTMGGVTSKNAFTPQYENNPEAEAKPETLSRDELQKLLE